jgi:pilus assembly protein CpaC
MTHLTRYSSVAFCGMLVQLCLGLMTPVWSQEVTNPRIEIEVGKSRIINSPKQIRRASMADPKFADALVLSPTQIYLVGKQVGETNLTLWDQDEQVLKMYELRVVTGLTWLKEQIYELLGEKNIQITTNQDYIALSGTVTSATNLTHALVLAEAFAPKKVLNLLQVGGNHQVMIEVRIAEMNRSLARRLGINLTVISGNDFGISQLGGLTSAEFDATGVTSTISSAVNALFQIQGGNMVWTAFIDALKTQGLVKILAEPNLVTLSGQEATFLAGGEVPILVAQALGANSIVFKQFGVAVTFKPTVLSSEKISMQVTPEFSEVDDSRGTVAGVPGFLTRRVSTVIELGDGQSFAIGGLIQDSVRESLSKYPFLGDVPVLGALFRSSQFEKNETELIIIVTPHLVKPLNAQKHPLPTDDFVEPDDFTFYILGELEQRPFSMFRPNDLSGNSDLEPETMFDGKLGHLDPQEKKE